MVRDTVSGQPVGLAIIRVAGQSASVITDDEGRFQIHADPGPVHLEVRRIGYRPRTSVVTAPDTSVVLYIAPIPVGIAGITVHPLEDPAVEIMRRVIAHKQNVLSHLHDYSYGADVKFVVRNKSVPVDSPSSILAVTESRTTAYWERPDHYQETIVARRQTGNVDPNRNLVSVGEIVNFAKDRIDLRKYSIVSPIATDALNHYDYRMLDTTTAAGTPGRVFTIAIVPKSESSPLFVGVLTVADSTYEVLSIDVGANSALRFTFVSNLRYHQQLADQGGGHWMPSEIRLTGEIHLAVPIPGIPGHLSFEHIAALSGFAFDQGNRPKGMGEYRVVVADSADRPDSTWAEAIPLTPTEREAWTRIDSIATTPGTFGHRMAMGLGAAVFLAANPTFFHYNRVDGAYVGAGRDWSLGPDWVIGAGAGYGFGAERWQESIGVSWMLSEDRQIWVGAGAYDQTQHRPTMVSSDYNPTFRNFLSRIDPLDYYRERGGRAFISGKLLKGTRLELSFENGTQSSLPVTTDYALGVPKARALRPNASVDEGNLRAVGATMVYDSRPLLRSKGRDYRLRQLVQTRITASAEVAAHDVLHGDFSYRRYVFRIERIQRTLNFGITSITAVGGFATGWLPPQRYFTVDFGRELYTYQPNGFNTLNGNNFSGTRAAMLTVNHDFDRLLFAKSRIPGIRSLPFTMNVHVGAFWSDFVNHPANPGDTLLLTAPKLYTEAGFGVGNLTPFLSPIDLAAYFTWQLSAYPTRTFRFGLGLTRL